MTLGLARVSGTWPPEILIHPFCPLNLVLILLAKRRLVWVVSHSVCHDRRCVVDLTVFLNFWVINYLVILAVGACTWAHSCWIVARIDHRYESTQVLSNAPTANRRRSLHWFLTLITCDILRYLTWRSLILQWHVFSFLHASFTSFLLHLACIDDICHLKQYFTLQVLFNLNSN